MHRYCICHHSWLSATKYLTLCNCFQTVSSPASARAAVATVSTPKRETNPKKRVVIIGMGLVSVFGNDVDIFYEKLLEGTNGISLN
jgi:hypothetical protein